MIVDSKGRVVETDPLMMDWQMKLGQERVARIFYRAIAVGIVITIIGAISATGLLLNWLTGSTGF